MNEQLDLFPEMLVTTLDRAREIIYGDREKTYGHPSRNLQTIAEMWNAYLAVKIDKVALDQATSWRLDTKDVCVLMSLVKAARFANDPDHEDNEVDAIGYWALVGRCR